jgi:hypothetical protein
MRDDGRILCPRAGAIQLGMASGVVNTTQPCSMTPFDWFYHVKIFGRLNGFMVAHLFLVAPTKGDE